MSKSPDAKVTWQGKMKFEGTAATGFTLPLDSAPQFGGENSGFRPMELLLVGLAGCTAMDVISILKKKRQDVTGFEIQVSSKRAEDHPRIYTEIEVEYVVTGHDIDPQAVGRAIELSETKYCSAHAMLEHAAEIRSRYTIHEAES